MIEGSARSIPDVPFPVPSRGLHALCLGVILIYCRHFEAFPGFTMTVEIYNKGLIYQIYQAEEAFEVYANS